MIPRLYSATDTTFTSFGEPLADCARCEVTEERNGEFILEMEYPKDGIHADELEVDKIILARPYEDADEAEPFRIVEVSSDINGLIQVNAQHVSYQLNNIIIGANSNHFTRYPATMWNTLTQEFCLSPNPFTFETDIGTVESTVKGYGSDIAHPLREYLGGMRGSMLDLFGGEFVWNRYKVKLLSARGENNGVVIAYGKNITGLDYDVDITEYYSGVVAYYSNGTDYVQSTLQTVDDGLSYNRTIVIDASSEFAELPTQETLNTWAANYLNRNYSAPKVSVSVEFIPLWQTEEYKDYYNLEHVKLCDTVKILYPPLNMEITAKVVKTVYDVLLEKYTEIVVGSPKVSLEDTIASIMKELKT